MEDQKFKQLAYLYFEGKIPLEKESELFEFITQNEQNKIQFQKWENEWTNTQQHGKSVDKDWDLLKSKIETRKTISPLLKVRKTSFFRRLTQVAAVAAILIISATVAISYYNSVSTSSNTNFFTVETPNGEKTKIILSDGTVVWLNSCSKLTYNSRFGTSERVVELEGEAYFDVEKQEKIPFKVKTKDYDVVVKGTKFNISSYKEDQLITTTLMEGKVQIMRQDKVLDMLPGEAVQMNVDTKQFVKTNVNTEQYKSWIDNKIEYDAITLDDLLNRLSRTYDVNILLQSNPKQKKMLNISIKNDESIDEILEGLSKVTPMKIEKKGKDIYVKLK